MFELRRYQTECLQAILRARDRGIHRALVQLPTGTGKTVIFSQLPKYTRKRTLVLAHREEMLEQARDKLQKANPSACIEIEQAERRASDADIVIASVPTLGRQRSSRLLHFDPGQFEFIVCDEAHHSVAETYKRVFDHFNVWSDKTKLLVGFTATPKRGDDVSLESVYEEIVYRKELREMIEERWLCPITAYRFRSETSLDAVRIRGGDFAVGDLSVTVNTIERNELVLRAYFEKLEKRKTIVFCVDVAHSYTLADLFRKWGIPARAVSAKTPGPERRKMIEDFRRGKLSVITNCEVLTEGFDEPSIEALVMARPTRSPLLYTQMIGRGTRKHPGKRQLIVVDVVDNCQRHSLMSVPVLFGLASEFDLEGKDALAACRKVEELTDRFDVDFSRYASLSALEAQLARLTEVDLFRPCIPPEVERYSRFAWLKLPDGYKIGWSDSPRRIFDRTSEPDEKQKAVIRRNHLKITENLLGQYELYLYCSDKGLEKLSTFGSLQEALAYGDRYIERSSSALAVLLRNARWRDDPPTEKQVTLLERLGIPFDRASLTKGQAALLISNFFAYKKANM